MTIFFIELATQILHLEVGGKLQNVLGEAERCLLSRKTSPAKNVEALIKE
jgi:hypothetical protein